MIFTDAGITISLMSVSLSAAFDISVNVDGSLMDFIGFPQKISPRISVTGILLPL